MFESKKIILAGITVNDDTFDLYTAQTKQSQERVLFGSFPLSKAQQSVLKRLERHDFLLEPLEMRVCYFNSDPEKVSQIECPYGMFYTGIGSFLPQEYDETFFEEQRAQWHFNDFNERRAYLERKRIEERWEKDEQMRRVYGSVDEYYTEMACAEEHFLKELSLPLRNAVIHGKERPVLVCLEAQELVEKVVRREKEKGRWGMPGQKNEKQFEAVIGCAIKKEYNHMKNGKFRFVCDYDFTPAMWGDIYLVALNYARLTELGRSYVPEFMRARFENREICSETQNAETYCRPVEPPKETAESVMPSVERPKFTLEGKETPSWRQGRPAGVLKNGARIIPDRQNTMRSGVRQGRSWYMKIKSSYGR